METAIAYIRVSDPRQVIDGNSLATQERQVREYAKNKGYNLERVFIEKGESAKTDARTVLQEMLSFCKQNRGQIGVLVYPKIDRFARNLQDYLSLKNFITNLDIRVESVGESIENSPSGRLHEAMHAAFAQYDNEVRAERALGGAIQAAREGRCVTRPRYGYRRVRFEGRVTVEPHPTQSQIVHAIFMRLASGQTLAEIRKGLRRQGVKIARSYLYRMVHDRTYLAIMDCFGETNYGAPPFTPIISQSLFDAAQLALRPRATPRAYSRDNPDFPLRGDIRCQCGSLLVGAWAHGRSRRYAYYRCFSCPGVNHQREIVHRLFCRELRKLQPDPTHFERVAELVKIQYQKSKRALQAQRTTLGTQICSLEKQRRFLARKIVQGIIPDDLAKSEMEELGGRLEAIKRELSSLTLPEEKYSEIIEFARDFLSNIEDKWTQGGILNQKRLQRFAFSDNLVLSHDGKIRTTKTEPSTGLALLSTSNLSSIVGQSDKTSNLVRRSERKVGQTDKSPNPVRPEKQRKPLKIPELIAFFLKLHGEFGALDIRIDTNTRSGHSRS